MHAPDSYGTEALPDPMAAVAGRLVAAFTEFLQQATAQVVQQAAVSTRSAAVYDPGRLLTIAQACERLAMSKTQLYRHLRRGEIAVVRDGRSVRLRVAASMRGWHVIVKYPVLPATRSRYRAALRRPAGWRGCREPLRAAA